MWRESCWYSDCSFGEERSVYFTKEYDEVQQNIIPFEQTEKYKSLVSLLEEKKKTITTIPEQDNSGLLSMKKALMSNIEEESKKWDLLMSAKNKRKNRRI